MCIYYTHYNIYIYCIYIWYVYIYTWYSVYEFWFDIRWLTPPDREWCYKWTLQSWHTANLLDIRESSRFYPHHRNNKDQKKPIENQANRGPGWNPYNPWAVAPESKLDKHQKKPRALKVGSNPWILSRIDGFDPRWMVQRGPTRNPRGPPLVALSTLRATMSKGWTLTSNQGGDAPQLSPADSPEKQEANQGGTLGESYRDGKRMGHLHLHGGFSMHCRVYGYM